MSSSNDWTIDPLTGRCNSSAEFERLVGEVERLIRDGAWGLINQGPRPLAGMIMAQLAHVHGLRPQEVLRVMSKPELTAERIEDLSKWVSCALHKDHDPEDLNVLRARTTLALIESRKQALELLREAARDDQTVSEFADLLARIAAFLEQNQ